VNDFNGSLSSQNAAAVAKLILSFALVSLIGAEPFLNLLNSSRAQPVEVLQVSDLPFFRLVSVQSENLPVELALVKKAKRTQNLYRLSLTKACYFEKAHLN
jgi:hypothetical protein